MEEPTEPDSDTDKVGRKCLGNSVGWKRMTSFRRDEDSVLSSSQFVFNTQKFHPFGKLSYFSQPKLYVLQGLGKPSTRKAWNYDWPEPRVG